MNDLLDRAQNGDLEAFALLFEPLRPKLFAVACRLVGPNDAEDMTMDTFLKAWKALPGYKRRSSLSTWLVRIARNQALDTLRARTIREARNESIDQVPGLLPPAMLSDPAASGPAEQLVREEDCRRCQAALEQLDEKHKTALLLRYYDDLGYAEIAAALGISIGTVMSRLFTAKRKMMRLLEDNEPGEPARKETPA